MYFLRKICLYIIIILLILSLYNDFKKGSYTYYEHEHQMTNNSTKEQAARVKFERGDTFLSISERLNGDRLSNLSIEEMIMDFQKLNPNDDVHSLQIGHYYLFPIYEKN